MLNCNRQYINSQISACSKDQYPKFIFKKDDTNTADKIKAGQSVTVSCADGYIATDSSLTTTGSCKGNGVMEFDNSKFDCEKMKGEFSVNGDVISE